jgi:hypothetical protein
LWVVKQLATAGVAAGGSSCEASQQQQQQQLMMPCGMPVYRRNKLLSSIGNVRVTGWISSGQLAVGGAEVSFLSAHGRFKPLQATSLAAATACQQDCVAAFGWKRFDWCLQLPWLCAMLNCSICRRNIISKC